MDTEHWLEDFFYKQTQVNHSTSLLTFSEIWNRKEGNSTMVTLLSEGSAASLSDSPRGLNTIPSILPTLSQVSREPMQNRTKGAFNKVKNPYLSTW